MIVGPARPRLESRHYTIAEAAARLFLGHGRHLGTGLGAPAMVQDLRGEGLERTARENSGAISLSLVDSRIKSIARLRDGETTKVGRDVANFADDSRHARPSDLRHFFPRIIVEIRSSLIALHLTASKVKVAERSSLFEQSGSHATHSPDILGYHVATDRSLRHIANDTFRTNRVFDNVI